MINEILQEKYGFYPIQSFNLSGYRAFKDRLLIYIMIEVFEKQQEELKERYQLANYLKEQNERYIPTIFPNKKGNFISTMGKKYFLLLKLESWKDRPFQYPGKRLARLHRRGFGYQGTVNKLTRYGGWLLYWEKRLEQMEELWRKVLQAGPANDFEILFIDSFPYYSGLCENAMQYFADTSMDETMGPFDIATVCHERFSPKTWDSPIVWKNPFDWVYDHYSRDLAEYTRTLYFTEPQFENKIKHFIEDYKTYIPLSNFALRLLYSRLLFPLHYFDCVEQYFANPNESQKERFEKLITYVNSSEKYEDFLADFPEIVEMPSNRMYIPIPKWLQKN